MTFEKAPEVKTNAQRVVQYQPSCEQCFRTAFDNEGHEYHKMMSRSDCNMVFFCPEDCQSASQPTHRQERCSDLQEIAASETLKYITLKETGELGIVEPIREPRSTYRPLNNLKTWKAYFDLSQNPLAYAINDSFQPINYDPRTQTIYRLLKITAESTTFILTILAGLEASIPDLANRTNLTIHIIGPDIQELKVMRLNEELLHLLPNLRHLITGHIGPDFPVSGPNSSQAADTACCPTCTFTGRKRQIFYSRTLYHDFCSHSPLATKYTPGMLVAFNSEHADSETDSWSPTLQKILEIGTPALFTTYNTRKCVDEGAVLERMGARFVVRPEVNRWSGLLPILDSFEARYETCFQNFWLYVVKGKRWKSGWRGKHLYGGLWRERGILKRKKRNEARGGYLDTCIKEFTKSLATTPSDMACNIKLCNQQGASNQYATQ